MKQPVAYLRKSKVTSTRHVSWEVQEAEVKALAGRYGDDGDRLLLLSDWSKSGRGEKTRFRPDYRRLKEMIAADQVSAVYSYSLSRVARSLGEYVKLAELCEAHKVPIRLAKEGALDYGTVSGRLLVHILAAAAQAEAEWGAERAADAVRARRDRGDVLGMAPYGYRLEDGKLSENPDEPLEPIAAAFRAAGSAFGAARLLNEQGIRSRRGAMWSSKVVGDVLRRAGVLSGRHKRPGAKPTADWYFYRLLVCPCGSMMTAMDRRGPRYVCWQGRHTPGHPKPYSISEAKLLPLVRAEADRLALPEEAEEEERDAEKRAGLGVKRERIISIFIEGIIDKAERDRRLGEVDDALEQLDAATRLVKLPPDAIDWSGWRPASVNDVLRQVFERIELGPDMLPARYLWRVPEWRQP